MEDLNQIKLVLVKKKRTGKWLAEQLGKSNCTVSKWCSNSAQPDLQTLAKIAELLEAEDTLTATQVAKTFNMTVNDFNAVLRDFGIQYRRGGHWNICDDLADRDFVRMRTHVSYSLKGVKKVKVYMTWTLDGLRYLNSKLGYPNF